VAACQDCQAQSFRGLPIPIIGYEDHLVPDDEWASRKRVFGGAPCAFHLVLVVHHFVRAAHSGVSAWQWTGGSCAYNVRPAFGDVLQQKLGVPAQPLTVDVENPADCSAEFANSGFQVSKKSSGAALVAPCALLDTVLHCITKKSKGLNIGHRTLFNSS
jgi:hypothetical protein